MPLTPPSPKDRAEICREFELAWKYGPDSYSAAINLLWSYEQLGRKAEAQALRTALVSGQKRWSFVDSTLAHGLNEQGKFQEALSILEKTPWPPDTPLRIELTLEIMRAKLGLGDIPGLVEAGGKRLSGCEHDEAKLHLLFHIEQYAKLLPKAVLAKVDTNAFEAALQKLAADSPDDAGIIIALSTYFSDTGRQEEEIDTLLAAVERHAESTEFRHHFARVVWRLVASQEDPAVP